MPQRRPLSQTARQGRARRRRNQRQRRRNKQPTILRPTAAKGRAWNAALNIPMLGSISMGGKRGRNSTIGIAPASSFRNTNIPVRTHGTDKLATIPIGTANNMAGQLLYALIIESSTLGDRLPILSSCYDKIQFNKLIFRIVSKAPTTLKGGYIVGIDSDPTDQYNSGPKLPDKIAALRNSVSASIWETTTISHKELPNESFFTELLATGRGIAGTAEVRQSSPGVLVMALDATADPCDLNVYVDWDVSLLEPSMPEQNSPPPTPPPVPSQYTLTAPEDVSFAYGFSDPDIPISLTMGANAVPLPNAAWVLPLGVADGIQPVKRANAQLPNLQLWLKDASGGQQRNITLICNQMLFSGGIMQQMFVTRPDGSNFIPSQNMNPGQSTPWTRLEGTLFSKNDSYLVNPISSFAFTELPRKPLKSMVTFGVTHNSHFKANIDKESRFFSKTIVRSEMADDSVLLNLKKALSALSCA
jgi:hypothetical protein